VPYDQYFPALWRAQAQRRVVEEFATLAPGLATQERGWPDLVAELTAALSPREVVLLPAPVTARDVLEALMPGVRLIARPAQHRDFPDTALAMLQRMYRTGVQPEPQQLMRLVAYHARQPQPAPIAAFSPLDAGLQRRRFQRDLIRMARQPGLSVGVPQHLIAAE